MTQYKYYTKINQTKQKTSNAIIYQNNENQKAISNLKQQMSHIREEMSKILKMKSEENLKLPEKMGWRGKDLLMTAKTNASSKEWTLLEIMQMQEKIKKLEHQNQFLQAKVKQMENEKNQERNKFKKLEKQNDGVNQIMVIKIRNLEDEVERLQTLNKKLQRNEKDSPEKHANGQFFLNPQLKLQLPSLDKPKSVQVPNKEIQRLLKIIHKLQDKVYKLQFANIQNLKVIENITEQLMKNQASKINIKYESLA